MNSLEMRMVEVLQDLKENHHVVMVKAGFESEGTRLEEAWRLKEVATKAGLDLTIKIGGCEALKDMHDARALGVTCLVAPMIESAYALEKYLQCVNMAFPAAERAQVEVLANIETMQAYKNFAAMLEIPARHELAGIVLGRVDMTGSLGMSREDVDGEKIFDIALNLLTKAKSAGLKCVIGGGVSAASLPLLRRLPQGMLDRYETRKVIFQCPGALDGQADQGILKSVGFELMWLKNKQSFYGQILDEDKARLAMLQARYDCLMSDAGGK